MIRDTHRLCAGDRQPVVRGSQLVADPHERGQSAGIAEVDGTGVDDKVPRRDLGRGQRRRDEFGGGQHIQVADGRGLLANAGHPPPVLRTRDGARLLTESSPLLGIRIRPGLRPATGTVVECAVDIRALAAARDAVASFASAHGISGEPLSDFILAANELSINAVRHGGGRGTLRIWYDAGTVWCQVSDDGPGIPEAVTARDPFADRPSSAALDGRGLWLVGRMTATTVVQTGAVGTTVTIAARH
jgi:anti-sigma regulatory factor (Ser/Thr protein kinase)